MAIEEDFPALSAWKESILPAIQGVPHLADPGYAVLAWYPSARRVLIWNLEEKAKECLLVTGAGRRPVSLEPLGVELVEV